MNEYLENRFIKYIDDLYNFYYKNAKNTDLFEVFSDRDEKIFREYHELNDILHMYIWSKLYWIFHRINKKYYDLWYYREYSEEAEDKFILDSKYKELEQSLHYPVLFETLWDFLQLIRYAEKCYFVDNNDFSNIFVISPIDEQNVRKFYLSLPNHKNLEIRFGLEKIKRTMGNDIDNMVIEVIHKDGLKMTNKFVIINNKITYSDESDKDLMRNLNTLLSKELILKFERIIRIVKENARDAFYYSNKDMDE